MQLEENIKNKNLMSKNRKLIMFTGGKEHPRPLLEIKLIWTTNPMMFIGENRVYYS